MGYMQMICDRCRKSVPMEDIKYLPEGKDSRVQLCSVCRAVFAKEEKKKIHPAKKKSTKQAYICTRCHYKFKFDINNETINFMCPYCGKDDKIIEDKVQSADKLIEESEGFY